MKHTIEETQHVFSYWLKILSTSCVDFDNGEVDAAMLMSVALRNLLKSTKKMTSLMVQLGLEDTLFLDSRKPAQGFSFCTIGSGVHNLTVLYSEDVKILLAALSISLEKDDTCVFRFEPLLARSRACSSQVDFDTWYNQPIYMLNGLSLTRKGLIECISEQDGGAHFDPDLSEEQYVALKQRDALHLIVNGQDVLFENNPAFVSIRQIAYEVLESFKSWL